MGGKAPLETGRRSHQQGIRFGPNQSERLDRAAAARGCTRAQLIREAVNDYLARLAEEGAVAS